MYNGVFVCCVCVGGGCFADFISFLKIISHKNEIILSL